MKTYKKCLSCFERQAADVCAISKLNEKETQAVLTAVQEKTKTFSCDQPPINMAIEIHDLVRSQSGIADPYVDIKKEANSICRECILKLTQIMTWSLTPLKTAVQLAIAGNIIDCGAYGLQKPSKRKLYNVIHEVLAQPLKGDDIHDFLKLILHAKQILYIGDNAGECFFDVPLLDLLPEDTVTYAVRGSPILNDATIEDAHAAGIHEKCRVIDTGDNAPGVLIDRCSGVFREAYDGSDLIISKGQGNYESLSDTTDKTIIFLTKVKCEVIAKDIGSPLDSNVIKILKPDTDLDKTLKTRDHQKGTEVCHV